MRRRRQQRNEPLVLSSFEVEKEGGIFKEDRDVKPEQQEENQDSEVSQKLRIFQEGQESRRLLLVWILPLLISIFT